MTECVWGEGGSEAQNQKYNHTIVQAFTSQTLSADILIITMYTIDGKPS